MAKKLKHKAYHTSQICYIKTPLQKDGLFNQTIQ